jgi:hypothetical protein
VLRRRRRARAGGHVFGGARARVAVRALTDAQDVRVVQAVRVRGEGCQLELGVQPETRRPVRRVCEGERDARESPEKTILILAFCVTVLMK